MNRFWEVIATACRPDLNPETEWASALENELARLTPDEILEFDRIFDALAEKAYHRDLWSAADLINGGASDDGFYYFRCWLIGKGRRVYEDTLSDPDTLAAGVDPGLDAEAEIYAAPQKAWGRVTGKEDEEYPLSLPSRHCGGTLKGERWDFNDAKEVRKRFPRLAALYLDGG